MITQKQPQANIANMFHAEIADLVNMFFILRYLVIKVPSIIFFFQPFGLATLHVDSKIICLPQFINYLKKKGHTPMKYVNQLKIPLLHESKTKTKDQTICIFSAH